MSKKKGTKGKSLTKRVKKLEKEARLAKPDLLLYQTTTGVVVCNTTGAVLTIPFILNPAGRQDNFIKMSRLRWRVEVLASNHALAPKTQLCHLMIIKENDFVAGAGAPSLATFMQTVTDYGQKNYINRNKFVILKHKIVSVNNNSGVALASNFGVNRKVIDLYHDFRNAKQEYVGNAGTDQIGTNYFLAMWSGEPSGAYAPLCQGSIQLSYYD